MQSWSDGMNLQPASSSPLLSFVSTHHDGNADNVVYKNLVEMFPLVDTLMVKRKHHPHLYTFIS